MPGKRPTLSAVDSDADGDTITHWWSVKTAPTSAKPAFGTPGHVTTNVSSLTVAGTYTFTISAIDRTHVTTKDVTVTVGAPIPGDINIDGAVDVLDLLALANSWALSQGNPGYDSRCDLNSDSTVDVIDLLILADYWS